jgi:MFS family permease
VSGHIQPTRLAVLIGIAVLAGAVSWGAALIYDNRTGTPPGVPWTAPLVIGFLAAVVFSVAVALRSRLAGLRAGRPDARSVDPGFAARALGLAKASALVGALVAGLYAGYGIFLARHLEMDDRRDRAFVCLFAVVAAVLLAAAGLWLERVLRVPPDEMEPPEDPAQAARR